MTPTGEIEYFNQIVEIDDEGVETVADECRVVLEPHQPLPLGSAPHVVALADATWTPAFVQAWKWANDIGEAPSPQEVLAAKVAAIQARRAQAIVAFSYLGAPVALSSQAQQDIGNAIAALARKPPGAMIKWEIVDGYYVEMDLPALEAFGDAAFDHVQACFDNSESMTSAALAGEPYDLEAGWP